MTAISIKPPGGIAAKTSSNTGVGATATDPWMRQGEERNEYDPLKFYTRATDWRGHGERMSMNIPPDVYAQVQVMVHEEDFPDYDIPQDFLRDAIVHHLATRKSQLGSMALRVAVEQAIRLRNLAEYAQRMKDDANTWANLDEDIRSACTTLQRDGAWDQLAVTLDNYDDFAEGIPEPYHSKSLTSIAEWRNKIPPNALSK
jgi:hypothetical protein